MRNFLLSLVAVIQLAGCAQLAGLGDWANENPLVADIVTRQAVARYIIADYDQQSRAARVVTVIASAEEFLDGNPTATVDAIFFVVQANINWEGLSIPDRILVEDLLAIIQYQLQQKQIQGSLDPDEVLGVRSLLKTARDAASLYVD